MAKRFNTPSVIQYFDEQPAWVEYGLVLLAVAATTATTLYIPVIGERAAFLLFLFSIIQTSFWLGLNSGVLSTALSLVAVNLFILFPAEIHPYEVLILNTGFCLVSAGMVFTTSLYRQSAKALWETKQDLDHAQIVGEIGSWRMNIQRNELRWSDENHRIFGIPKGTPMTYEAFLITVHPDDREYVDRMWQAGLRGEPYDIEHRVIVAGEVKWVREKAVLEFSKHGNLLGGFGTTQDITERKHTEQILQERIARYELVLDGAQDGIWDWDVANKRVHFSSRWKALRGFAEQEISNDEIEWSANIHPDDATRVFAAVQSHFEGKTAVFCEEYRVRCKDGAWKWILDRGIAQRNSSGKVIRMAGSETDITERKLTETVLFDQEIELRLIIDATPALISYLDTDFRYIRVNATYENWFGMSSAQILGHKAADIVGETAWSILQPYLERVLAGEHVSFDQQIPYGHGKPRWVHATYIPNTDSIGTVKGIVVHVMDIEEQKLAEQKIALLNQRLLRQLEEMLVIFNTVPIGLAIADDNRGLHIRGNPAIEQMLGLPAYSELSLCSETSPNYVPMQNGCPLVVEELPMQRATGGEIVTDQIMDIVRPDGKIITVLCNASPLFDDAGQPRGAIGAFMDITPLKDAEDAVRKSEAFVRSVLNSLPAQVVVLDERGVVSTVNEPWERFATENGGAARDVSVGVNYLDVCRRSFAAGDRDAGKAIEGLEALFGGERQQFVMEYPCQTPDRKLWFLMYAKPVIHGFQGVIITHVDITEHKYAEEALRESEARLALVVEEVKAGYWDWDLMSRTLFLSPEWKRQIGFTDFELRNQWEEWESRLHPNDRAMVLAATEDYLAGRQPVYELEFRLRHKDGSYRWIHSRGSLLHDQNHRPNRLLGINLDITDYKQAKEIGERRDKMEQAFRVSLAAQTIAAIAHELNQPLAAISSYADVALHLFQSGNPNPQKLSHVLEACVQQAQRAGQVIRQLLSQLNKTETNTELNDINFLVNEALNFVKKDIGYGDFKIEVDLAAGLPPVLANALQIEKVLVNLIRNGLESMQEQGKPSQIMNLKTCRYSGAPNMVQVTVCDSGTGLQNPALLKTLFQPFYTTKAAGLGMGLAISRALIQSHGGNMWAEQNVGNGLSVHFTLPFEV